jgi:hypothetical protein
MIEALDSASEPSAAQVQAARRAGRRVWGGYLATGPYDGGSHFGLWHPWSQQGFANAKLTGSPPLAYCSGSDNPVALSNLAASLGVRLCLDVENGIRGDGLWVQGWLDQAPTAGLYGNAGVHNGRRAAFHILAAYPTAGDPGGESWPQWLIRPTGPCGWQWAGTHTEFGIGVDSSWLDDWFAGLFSASGNTLTVQSQIHQEDSNMVVLTNHPSGRVDGVIVGTDGGLYHLSAPSSAEFDANPTIHGIPGVNGNAVLVGASWAADFTSIEVSFTGKDRQVYRGAIDDTATMVRSWVAVNGAKGLLPSDLLRLEGADDDSAYATKKDLVDALAALPKPPTKVDIVATGSLS